MRQMADWLSHFGNEKRVADAVRRFGGFVAAAGARVLAAVFEWFTDRRDTRVLKGANMLLEELS
jgi:hypothetical protein